MAHFIIEVPVRVYDAIQELQHRILAYEIEVDEARTEMQDLLAPYCRQLPTDLDTTTIQVKHNLISFPTERPN
jgi:hypothetical protein